MAEVTLLRVDNNRCKEKGLTIDMSYVGRTVHIHKHEYPLEAQSSKIITREMLQPSRSQRVISNVKVAVTHDNPSAQRKALLTSLEHLRGSSIE